MVFGCFSSSSFICLGVTLVLIGILGYLISKKFQDQNHKISTMCELVTTMAQDLQMLKMQNAVDKIQHSLQTNSSHSLTLDGASPFTGKVNDTIVVGGFSYSAPTSSDLQNKIVVSDDECSVDESDDSSLEDYCEDVDNSSDDEIEITEIEKNTDDEDEDDDVSVVNIQMDDQPIEMKQIDIALESYMSKEQGENYQQSHPQIVVSKLEVSPSPFSFLEVSEGVAVEDGLQELDGLEELQEIEEKVEDVMEMSTNETTTENNKTNQLSPAAKPKKSKPSRSNSAEEVDGNEGLEDFSGDYSKLNVTQLRKIVTDRGLSTHATKLKKTELLQLLGSGVSGGSVGIVELGEIY
jgi:hypothetical protein